MIGWAAFAVTAALLGAPPVAQPQNLAPNPSFEEGEGETPEGWFREAGEAGRTWATDEVHSGQRSIKIECAEAGPTLSWTSDVIPVTRPDQQFVLSVWAKLKEVTGRSGAFIGFYHTDENGERIGQSGGITIGGMGESVATEDWKQYLTTSVLTPEVKGVRVNLRLYGASGTAWFDDVEVTAYTPMPIDRPRPLRYGIRLGDCALVSCDDSTEAVVALRAALRRKGIDVPVLADGAVDLATETRDLIVLGNLATSAAVEYLYRRMYTYEDLYYPGAGGYVLRPLVDPLGTGGNILVVGASDAEGLRAGVEALLPMVARAGEVLAVPLTVQTGEGYIGLSHLPWPGSGPRREMAPAAEYLKHGTIQAAQEYRRMMLDFARAADQELADPDASVHLTYVTRTMSWDLMESCGVFSDAERLEIAQALLKILRSKEGYGFVNARTGMSSKENHATRGTRAFYYGWRYFSKYYADELGGELTAWRRALEQFWSACFASSRTYEDSLSQHALGGSMDNILDIALQEPEWSADWFASGLARRMGERCIAIVNNMGLTVMLGDTNLGDYPAPVFSKLAYALGDGRYEFMLRKRGAIGSSSDEAMRGFNVGIEPVLPEDHLGLTVVPADELYFTTALRNTAGVALQDAFDKASFRSGFEPTDEYLMIDGTAGGSHSYDDANSIGEFSANERRWLVEIDIFNGPTMAFHNAVTVARGGLGQSLVPQAAELADRAEGDGWAYTATRLPYYNGVHWTRHTLWMPGRQTVVLDELTAYEPGDYCFVLGWRSLGEPALQAGRFEAAQDDIERAPVYASGVDLYEAITRTSGKVARAMPDYNALLYRSEQDGDFVEASFEVPEAGEYEIVLQTLDYSGRGIMQVIVDGEPVGAPIDIFHSGQPRLRDSELGTHRLDAGRHTIRFEVVGRNPASDNSFIAVCGLAMYRPGEREAAAQTAANRLTLAFPVEVPATLDRDTETLGNYLPVSVHHDQALNILEQNMTRELSEGESACFVNAFSAWRGDDPGLELRQLSDHCALVRRGGEIALVGAGIGGAQVEVGPLSASGRLFFLSPSRVVLHEAQASLGGRDLVAGEAPDEALARALQAAWDGAEQPQASRTDPWADAPRLQARWTTELPGRPLSVAARRGEETVAIAAGLADGTVLQLDPQGLAGGSFATGGPVHALEAADLDGDGAEELLVGSDDEHMYALDGRMREIWRHKVDFLADQQPWLWWTLGSAKVRAIHAADITGDGRAELLVGAGNMRLQCYDAAGELMWRFRTDHGICTTITTADLFGDGRRLVLAGNGLTSDNGTCWVLDAAGQMIARYYNGSWCTSLPAIAVGDLEDDGVNTVFTGSNRGDVRAYAPDAGYTEHLWLQNLPRPIRSLTVVPRPGGDVLAVGSDSGYLCAFDQAGEKAWGVGLSSAITFTALVRRADGVLLAAGCKDGRTFLLTPEGRPTGLFDAGARLEAMAVADLDADGSDELVVATSGPERVHVVALP
ncbi:MAG: hypothetical protein AB7Y46_05825 [Armatimonadota bacterium]